MDRDSDVSKPDELYNELQGRAELLEPSENRNPKVPDGGSIDRIDIGSDDKPSEVDDTHLSDYKRLRKRYERFHRRYDELQEKHIETQDELNSELRTQNEMLIEEYGDVVDLLEQRKKHYNELNEAYAELVEYNKAATEKLIYALDNYSDSERSSALRNVVEGSVFGFAGLLAADQYSFDGAFDFYANAASNYANDPETMILTLGLPLIGTWFLFSALGSWRQARELDDAADTWRRRRGNIRDLEDIESWDSRDLKEVDMRFD